MLPRLVNLIEVEVIKKMRDEISADRDVFVEALELLQPCQVRFTEKSIKKDSFF